MALYKYTAIDDYGKPSTGQMEIENEKALEEHLTQKGFYLLSAGKEVPEVQIPTTKEYDAVVGEEEAIFSIQGWGYHYMITPTRIISREGFFRKDLKEIHIADIRDIWVKQGIFDRLNDIGSIGFSTAGTNLTEVVFLKIKSPMKIKELVRKLREQQANTLLQDKAKS